MQDAIDPSSENWRLVQQFSINFHQSFERVAYLLHFLRFGSKKSLKGLGKLRSPESSFAKFSHVNFALFISLINPSFGQNTGRIQSYSRFRFFFYLPFLYIYYHIYLIFVHFFLLIHNKRLRDPILAFVDVHHTR